jgi:hypothetical protein
MNGNNRPRNRQQRRGGPARDGRGPGAGGRNACGRRNIWGGDSSLGGRTATRALVAVGAYVAQDLRDADGMMRPALRRAAIRLALSPRKPARRLGAAYLRLDPPAPGTDPRRRDVIEVVAVTSPKAIAPAPGAERPVREDDRPPS